MNTHCHRCGGFIANPGGTTYRESSVATPVAIPHSALCLCEHAIIYGPVPELEGERKVRGVHHIRSASRN
jgi:hypothetical protein